MSMNAEEAQRDQNQSGQGIMVSSAYKYWMHIKTGSCRLSGIERTNLPSGLFL